MYGTKQTSKSTNKGAQGQDLKNKKQVSAEKVETKVEGSKTTEVEDLIKNDPESKKAYNEISQEVNRKEDEAKEAAARKEIPGAKTEINDKNVGITKDENTGKNDNVVKKQEEKPAVPEKLVSEDGKETTIDVNSVVDVPAQEKAPEVKAEENKKAEEKTTNGIASMFPEETEEDSAKEFSKQVETEIKEEAPVVEDKKEVTKEVLPTTESTEKEEATIVETKKEEKAVETTKEAPKAEVVEKTVEVKKEVKKQEEKPAPANAQFAETVVVASRDAKAQFSLTAGKIVTVQNSDEQITVSNNGSSIVVTNNFPEFDGTVSFTAVDEAGQATNLTVIFK